MMASWCGGRPTVTCFCQTIRSLRDRARLGIFFDSSPLAWQTMLQCLDSGDFSYNSSTNSWTLPQLTRWLIPKLTTIYWRISPCSSRSRYSFRKATSSPTSWSSYKLRLSVGAQNLGELTIQGSSISTIIFVSLWLIKTSLKWCNQTDLMIGVVFFADLLIEAMVETVRGLEFCSPSGKRFDFSAFHSSACFSFRWARIFHEFL